MYTEKDITEFDKQLSEAMSLLMSIKTLVNERENAIRQKQQPLLRVNLKQY